MGFAMMPALFLTLLIRCAVVSGQTATTTVTTYITSIVTVASTNTGCGINGFFGVRPKICTITDSSGYRHLFSISEHLDFNLRIF